MIAELDPSHALLRDELFGPVTAVVQARDEAEALRLANATEFGLAASVFTRELGRALAFGRRLEAGMVFVNAATVEAETHLPFGGIKSSGNGSRDTGITALPIPNGSPSTSPRLDARLLEPGRQVHDEPTERQWRTA